MTDIKKVLRKYDYYTLDSLLLLLEKAGESRSRLYQVIDNVCDEKYAAEEFDGRNEYDYLTRVNSFNLDRIINDADMLTNREFSSIYGIVLSSYKKIIEQMKEAKTPDTVSKAMCEQLSTLVSKCESRSFFLSLLDKLDQYDRFVVRLVMEYAADYYEFTEEGVKILDRMLDYDCVFFNAHGEELSNLTKKELDILYDLTIDADGVLGIDFNNERENERKIVYDFLNRIEKTKDDMKSKGSKKYRP